MNKLILCFFLFISIIIKAQTVPQGINYQAVVRNSTGVVITNTVVSMKFELFNTSTSTFTYSETHTALQTGTVGVVTCTIGMGLPATGYNFNNVNWIGGDVWYQAYLNIGFGFNAIGPKQKFMTVPYAFYAAQAPSTFSISGNSLYSVGGSTITIPSGGSLTSTITSSGLAIVTPTSGSIFNVAVPTPTLAYLSTNSLFSIKQGTFSSNTVTISPILSLNPSTGILYSGVSSNAVSLFSIPTFTLWSNIGANIYPTTLSGNVGIGTTTFDHKLKVVENTNTIGSAIYGLSNSTSSLSAAIYGINTAAGSSIFGNKISGTTGNAGMFIMGLASSTYAAVYAQSQSTSSLSAGVWGHNINNGIGVYGDGNNGVGVFGSSATNSGIYGVSNSGNAGKFILPLPSNTSNAVRAETNGSGAAIYAKSWNPNPIALEIDGHIKSSGASPTTSLVAENIYGYSGSSITVAMNPSYTNTDASGNVKVNFPNPLGIGNASGTSSNYSYVVVRVIFNKNYTSVPKINITPVVSGYSQIFNYAISNQTTSSFDVFINYSFGSSISTVPNISFNYFIIE